MPYYRRAGRGFVASHACVISGRQRWGLEEAVSYGKGAGRRQRAIACMSLATIDVAPIRVKLGMTQEEFAGRFGFASLTRRRVLTEVATGVRGGMRAVGLKILKNKLSEYIRLAESGETVLVTDRDAVVAEIGPPHPGRSSMLADAHLADAVRKGWVTPPTLASDAQVPRKPVMPFSELAREIEADRTDR